MTIQKKFPRNRLACDVVTLNQVIDQRGYVAGIGHSAVDIQLSEEEIKSFAKELLHGTRQKTRNAFWKHAEHNFKLLPCLAILDYVTFRNDGCVINGGQDYTVTLNAIREIIREY